MKDFIAAGTIFFKNELRPFTDYLPSILLSVSG